MVGKASALFPSLPKTLKQPRRKRASRSKPSLKSRHGTHVHRAMGSPQDRKTSASLARRAGARDLQSVSSQWGPKLPALPSCVWACWCRGRWNPGSRRSVASKMTRPWSSLLCVCDCVYCVVFCVLCPVFCVLCSVCVCLCALGCWCWLMVGGREVRC